MCWQSVQTIVERNTTQLQLKQFLKSLVIGKMDKNI